VPPESLQILQRRFWRLITAPEGVAAGLPEVANDDPAADPVAGWIAADDEDTARERLDVYASMYFFRLLDALKSDVPKVAQLLGNDAFHNLVVDYLLAHPSTHPSLRHVAASMPDFLARHRSSADRPDLPDLARLELARNDAFDGPNSDAIDARAMSAFPPEVWPSLRFRIARTVQWLRLRASTVPTWRALADGEPLPDPSADLSGCIVWRSRAPGSEDQVWHRAASLTEVEAVSAAAAGATFAQICEIFAASLVPLPTDAAEAARPALEALVRWIADGLVAGAGA
jgi:putative DNA-binding protein